MLEQVQVPHSVIEDKQPQPGELIEGALAVNLKDFRLYSKGYDGVVVRLSGRIEVKADDIATDATVYIPWVKKTTGNLDANVSSAKLSFNPASGLLSASSFAGDGGQLTGFTPEQIEGALGYLPVEPIGATLAPEASDLDTAIALANSMRAALISSGIGA